MHCCSANMARHTHFLFADQHDSVLRQNEWLTLPAFRLSKYLSPALRMGINSSFCKLGNFGTENRLDYTLLGRAVNLASRLESSAESNEILIFKDTYDLVKSAVHCVDKGQIPIKGFATAVDVYSVIDLHKNLKSDSSAQIQRQAIA
jgi:class 3 adenylate cyclase